MFMIMMIWDDVDVYGNVVSSHIHVRRSKSKVLYTKLKAILYKFKKQG